MNIEIITYKEIKQDLSIDLQTEINNISKLDNTPNQRYNKCLFDILCSIEYKFNTDNNLIIIYSNKLIFFSQSKVNLY